MTTASYLDIHTHLRGQIEGVVSVSSLSLNELKSLDLPQGDVCAGIHPWWPEDISLDEIEELKAAIKKLAESNRLWGIGETGLDRLYPEFFDLQKDLFQWHFDLAETHQLPLVLHNVRSGSDFLEILKNRRPSTPWLFHDFRGNEELVASLLKLHPDCYFSFGISLDNSPQVRELLGSIPLEHLFIETDNQKHLDIHDLYLRAAEQLHVDLDFLKSQVMHNFKKLTRSIQ